MRILNRALLIIMAVLLFSCTECAAGQKGSGIGGKVVDKDGKPLAGIKIVAFQKEPLKGYEKFEVKTKSDGSFAFKGLYPESEYVIVPDAEHFNKQGATVEIESAPVGKMKMLKNNIVLKFSPFKVSKEGIITDTRTGLQWAPDTGREMNHYQAESYAQGLNLDGGGWRLPTMSELRGLYDEAYEGKYSIDPLFTLTS